MANNDLKVCSTSLVIREMQIKTIEKCHVIHTHLAKGRWLATLDPDVV
jgi:hypothetical protein